MRSIISIIVVAMASYAAATPSPKPLDPPTVGLEGNSTLGPLQKRGDDHPCANTGWKQSCFMAYWGKDCYVKGYTGLVGNNPHWPEHQACWAAPQGSYPDSIWVQGSGCITRTWSNSDCTGSSQMITHPDCTVVKFRSVSVDC